MPHFLSHFSGAATGLVPSIVEEPAFGLFAWAKIICPVFRNTVSSGLIVSLAEESPRVDCKPFDGRGEEGSA